MRRDELYLNDIVEAALHIAAFIAGADFDEFRKSEIIAFRNILIHAYFGIDWDEVWRTARNRCPVLCDQVTGILAFDCGLSDITGQ